MKIVAIAGSQIPSDTANSIQVMKACSALAQLGHDLTLLVPRTRQTSIVDLKTHYGLAPIFPSNGSPRPAAACSRGSPWDAPAPCMPTCCTRGSRNQRSSGC
jgi:hypothetical protein